MILSVTVITELLVLLLFVKPRLSWQLTCYYIKCTLLLSTLQLCRRDTSGSPERQDWYSENYLPLEKYPPPPPPMHRGGGGGEGDLNGIRYTRTIIIITCGTQV